MEGDRERLRLEIRPAGAGRERVDAIGPRARLRRELESVLADVGELVDPDDPAGDVAGATGDARNERVALGETAKLGAGLRRDSRVVAVLDDRRQDAVHVQEERCAFRFGCEGGERIHSA